MRSFSKFHLRKTLSQQDLLEGLDEDSWLRSPFLWRSVFEALVLTTMYLLFLRHWADHALRMVAQDDVFGHIWVLPPIIFSCLYLVGVFCGARLMENRTEPYTSRIFECMLVYNIFQTALNAWCFREFVREVLVHPERPIWGIPFKEEGGGNTYLHFLIWIHYNNKYLELLDTLFVIVRKKFTRLSVLHVYQKLLMIWSWFFACRVGGCGGDIYFGAMVNSLVMVLTYSYYVMSMLRFPQWCARKTRLVQLHILQFFVCGIHSVYVLYRGEMPMYLPLVQLFVMCNLLILFTNFYYEEFESPAEALDASLSQGPKLVVSFDSSGWFYCYHFGVARFIEQHVLPSLPHKASVGFTGSSGGALVSGCLCVGINIETITQHVISRRHVCAFNPFAMFPEAENALRMFLPSDSHLKCTGRLRVLLTKVLPRPPFFMGAAPCHFKSFDDLFHTLRASCHVPIFGGVLPYKVEGRGLFYDGCYWSSFFVPWRTLQEDDRVIKTSAVGSPFSQIRPPNIMPFWWALFPPKEEVLQGMYQQGYEDARVFFNSYKWNGSSPPSSPVGHRLYAKEVEEVYTEKTSAALAAYREAVGRGRQAAFWAFAVFMASVILVIHWVTLSYSMDEEWYV